MNTFYISETSHVNATRQGEYVQADSLALAKRKATTLQCFQGTVMKIEDSTGNLICFKENGKWMH